MCVEMSIITPIYLFFRQAQSLRKEKTSDLMICLKCFLFFGGDCGGNAGKTGIRKKKEQEH